MNINTYSEDNRYAESKELALKTNSFLHKKLSKYWKIESILPVTDKRLQKNGVDKLMFVNSQQPISIEEKIRRFTRNDILVELIGDHRYYLKKDFALGWGLRDYKTDLLLYYFEDTNTGYVFNWKKFQKAFLKNLPIWHDFAKKRLFGFSLHKAYNDRGYHSINIAIPKDRMIEAYIECGGKII